MRVSEQKIKEFAETIFRNPDLVYEFGLMNEESMNTRVFVEFPEEIQQAWFTVDAKDKKLFFKRLGDEVKAYVVEELTKSKKIKYLTIAKYSYIISDKEVSNLKQKYSSNTNIVKLCLIRELSGLLKDAKIMEGEAELTSIVNSAKRIYALGFAKTKKKGGKA